jgi:hypothetical protein
MYSFVCHRCLGILLFGSPMSSCSGAVPGASAYTQDRSMFSRKAGPIRGRKNGQPDLSGCPVLAERGRGYLDLRSFAARSALPSPCSMLDFAMLSDALG